MAWRVTGAFRPPEEIRVLTCDVCERDIGFEDGRRPSRHYRLTQHPNAGGLDEQAPPVCLCSATCLQAHAASLSDDGGPPTPSRRSQAL